MNQFAHDVLHGLNSKPRSLPSKYFYDKAGDELFVNIMHCDDYYLTRSEMEIIKTQAVEIVNSFATYGGSYDLIELGAGDGSKTIELLKKMPVAQVVYKPIDISPAVLQVLQARVKAELPALKIEPISGDYFQSLASLRSVRKKVVLFLGSNLGNMTDAEAGQFLKQLAANLDKGDKLLLGLDLIKSSEIIEAAYNDAQGFTREFNLNLLRRINKELGGNFALDQWEHAPFYDAEAGIAKSYLRSKCEQTVHIEALEHSFLFEEAELIHTEISRKYNEEIITNILAGTGFVPLKYFFDSKHYFTDLLLERS